MRLVEMLPALWSELCDEAGGFHIETPPAYQRAFLEAVMRYLMLAVLGLSLASPVLVGCESESSKTKTTSRNPITGTVTEKQSSSSHTDTNNP